MADLQAPRGMSDVLPEDEPLWRFVRDTAERVARSFDYRLINTPIVEDVRVFSRTSGDESDIVSKEMYVFEDRGGGELALRPEGTAAVCRAYIEHGMGSRPQPVRLYYFGPMFRYDRPQAGRYRQLWQFGVECIGDPSPAADAEIIELQYTLFRELGLDDLTLSINSIGTAETRRTYVDVLRRHLEPHLEGLSQDSQRRFGTNVLRILDSKEDAGHPALQSAPSILDYLTDEDAQHFEAVRSLLDASGVPYEVAPRIVRGLDYYARTVWEFEPPAAEGSDSGQQGTVSAGGRYDGLMELLGGPPTPGTGTAMGVERTVLNLRARGIEAPSAAPVDVVTIPLGGQGPAAALRLAQSLRAAGLTVRAGIPGRSLRAQLRGADAAGARYAAILGDDEAARGVVQLKHLARDGEQREVAVGDAAGVVGSE
ncbi:MAG: histidine--tRNA ligase [Chloroflexi bacterium]|nr:histidine--tRNA ligase [Chloroflexota bacterium]MYD65269.1 histidine--tRNA ligase [Chloroflexota bacterium]